MCTFAEMYSINVQLLLYIAYTYVYALLLANTVSNCLVNLSWMKLFTAALNRIQTILEAAISTKACDWPLSSGHQGYLVKT